MLKTGLNHVGICLKFYWKYSNALISRYVIHTKPCQTYKKLLFISYLIQVNKNLYKNSFSKFLGYSQLVFSLKYYFLVFICKSRFFMQLFERVKMLAKAKEKSANALAKKLNIAQTTFNGYLKESRQNNLWEILPKILELYPDVSRDWLYFGEGEMLLGEERAKPETIQELKNKIQELEQELSETNKINRQLTAKLLIDGNVEKDTRKTA